MNSTLIGLVSRIVYARMNVKNTSNTRKTTISTIIVNNHMFDCQFPISSRIPITKSAIQLKQTNSSVCSNEIEWRSTAHLDSMTIVIRQVFHFDLDKYNLEMKKKSVIVLCQILEYLNAESIHRVYFSDTKIHRMLNTNVGSSLSV